MGFVTKIVVFFVIVGFINITYADEELPIVNDKSLDDAELEDNIKHDEMLPVIQDGTNLDIDNAEGSGEEPPPVLLKGLLPDLNCDVKEDVAVCEGRFLNKIPDTLPSSITVLSLDDNNIEKLSGEIFSKKFESLKQINLANNDINTIESSFFEYVPTLERLNLSDNDLLAFNSEAFSKASFLIELSLSGNPIKIDENNPLLYSSSLKILKLQRCNLEHVPENTFDGVSSLEELDLGGNPINMSTPLTSDIFAALTNLSGLVLPDDSGEELVMEVCKTHGLLPAICLDSCDHLLLPCGEADLTSDAYYTDESSYNTETTTEESEVSEMIKPPRRSGSRNRTRENMISPEDTVPESSRTGVTGSEIDHTIIGIIVGVLIVATVLIIVKKNWNRIKQKVGMVPPTVEPTIIPQEEQHIPPEFVPLKSQNRE